MALILTIESTENEKDLISIIEGSFPDSTIILASESHTAIALAIENYPDVIIMGTFANNHEQIIFCSQIKKDERLKDIPLIFLISNAEDTDIRRKALKSGADALITYPLDELELSALIRVFAKTTKQPNTKISIEQDDNFRSHAQKSLEYNSFFAEKDVLKLIHELEVHQIELELQNEELRITKNKAEEALRENYSKLELAMQVAKQAWWGMNIQTGNITFDKRKAEMLGYPPEILKHYSDYMALVHPDDSKKVKNAMRSYLKGLSEKYEVEYRILNQKGSYLWFYDIGAVEKRNKYGNPLTIAGIVTDITSHKNTEAKLRKSEANIIAAVRAAGLHFYEEERFGSDRKYSFTDKKTISLMGLSNVENNRMFDFWQKHIHPDDLQDVLTNQAIGFEKGLMDIVSMEYRYFSDEQGMIWIHHIIHALQRDETGQILHFVGAIQDITEQKQAEQKLRKSEEKFRSIFTTLQDACLQTDIHGNFVLVSPSAVRMFGFESPEEMIKTPASERYAHVTVREKMLEKLKIDGELSDYIVEGKKKNGTLFWISMNVQFTYENGNITGTMGVIRDITERKKHEDKINTLTTAIEQSQLSIVITDINGNIEYINPRFSEVTGYASEEAIGRNLSIIKSGTTPDLEYQQLWETISSGRNWKGEFINRKKNGELYYELASISPVIDKKNQISHYIAIMEDITDKKQLIDDLIRAKEKAEESDRLKTSFLANMSHEIRTPLNSIIGFSELLLKHDLKPEQQRKFILNIQNSGDGLLSIISDIMDISMIETGQVKLSNHRFSINNLILDIYHEYSYKEEKGIEFRLNKPDQETIFLIESDEARIRQILTNFISNSIKFTKKGFIEIGFIKIPGGIQIHVKDTGIGIPQESQKIIFERFQQLETTYTRNYCGNGLGLTISRKLADMLGGKIWMESEPGKGSTFYLSLNTEQNI